MRGLDCTSLGDFCAEEHDICERQPANGTVTECDDASDNMDATKPEGRKVMDFTLPIPTVS